MANRNKKQGRLYELIGASFFFGGEGGGIITILTKLNATGRTSYVMHQN